MVTGNGSVNVASTLLWFLFWLGWLALLIFTIVHCIRRVRPVWRAVLISVALLILPFLTVSVYWLVYLWQARAARKKPASSDPLNWPADTGH
jgi:hypothetical protein